jgi:hypothetical protein
MMNDPALRETFDYSILDEQTREIVMRKTDETRLLMRRTTEHIIAIGENLLTVQKRLPELKFSAWLRTEFALSRESAYNFLKVASTFGDSCKTVLQLPASVLYVLASSSEAIIEQVEAGQLPPTLDAIRAAREAERQARAEAQARQEMIEQLTHDLEGLRQRLCAMPIPQVEIREVEKRVVPPETLAQLDTLQQNIVMLTEQRDTVLSDLPNDGQAKRETEFLLRREQFHLFFQTRQSCSLHRRMPSRGTPARCLVLDSVVIRPGFRLMGKDQKCVCSANVDAHACTQGSDFPCNQHT